MILTHLSKVELLVRGRTVFTNVEARLLGHHTDLLNGVLHDFSADKEDAAIVHSFLVEILFFFADLECHTRDRTSFLFFYTIRDANNKVMSILGQLVKKVIIARNVPGWALILSTSVIQIITLNYHWSDHLFER